MDTYLVESLLEAYSVLYEVGDVKSINEYVKGEPKYGDYIIDANTDRSKQFSVVCEYEGKPKILKVGVTKTPSPFPEAPNWYNLIFTDPKNPTFNASNEGNSSMLGYVWTIYRMVCDEVGFDGFSYIPSDDNADKATKKDRLWRMMFKKFFREYIEVPTELIPLNLQKMKFRAFVRRDLVWF